MTFSLPRHQTRSTKRFAALLLAAATSLGACVGSNDTPTQPGGTGTVDSSVQAISPAACLRKAALDLTEQGPSDQDIADITTAKKSFANVVDGYLNSPAFAQVAFQWFLETFEPTSLIPNSADRKNRRELRNT